MLKACPGFRSIWQEHLGYGWDGKPVGEYSDAAEFARYLVENLQHESAAEFKAAFEALERVIVEGDEDARGVAIVGIIEGIQTIGSHHPLGTKRFEPRLLPKSREAWFEIEKAWEGKGSLADVIRAEARQAEAQALPFEKRWWEFWK